MTLDSSTNPETRGYHRCAETGEFHVERDDLAALLDEAEAVQRVRELHERRWGGHGPDTGSDVGAYCAHCSRLRGDYAPWPCATMRALDGPHAG